MWPLNIKNYLSPVEEVEEMYQDWSSVYEDDLNQMGYLLPGFMATIFSNYVRPSTDLKILEAGAGTGFLGHMLSTFGFTPEMLHGVDLTSNMLAKAKQRGVYGQLSKANLLELPFKSHAFDHVVSIATIGVAPPESLKELVRVTKPNGYIIFTITQQKFNSDPVFSDTISQISKTKEWTQVRPQFAVEAYARESDSVPYYIFVYQKTIPVL